MGQPAVSTQAKPQAQPAAQARVIAITSGKGGVGKSNITVNLAIALAQSGKRVTVWDLDLGLANADVLLGIKPNGDLGDVVAGDRKLSEIVIDGPGGMRLIPGASGDEHLANLDSKGRKRLIDALSYLAEESDFILLDTGAGISANTIGIAAAADDIIVVSTPEPTAMVDAYAAIKLVFQSAPDSSIHFLVNMARNKQDARRAALKMIAVAEGFIGRKIKVDGYLPYDEAVSSSVRRRQPFMVSAKDSPIARAVRTIATAINRIPPLERNNRDSSDGFLQRLMRRFGA